MSHNPISHGKESEMNMLILRVVFGLGFVWAWHEAVIASESVGLYSGSFPYVGLPMIAMLFLAVANAVVWAPAVGAWMVSPLTGSYLRASSSTRRNRMLRALIRMDRRGWRHRTTWGAFFSGWMHPAEPEIFYLGFQNASPGSGLQRYFARRVYQFQHGRRCLEAYRVLESLGETPPPHREQSINAIILACRERPAPSRQRLAIPVFEEVPQMSRNTAIRLPRQFAHAAGSPRSVPGSVTPT